MEYKKAIYPIEPWNITETAFSTEYNYRNETTFSLSNGYIGTRGTFEEAYPFDIDTGLEGNFINGFYESEQIRYGEANFGSPLLSQSLLNLPNLKETRIQIEGEVFDMRTGRIEDYQRTLNMKNAILTRSLIWTSPTGKRVRIQFERLVSFEIKNIMAISIQVMPLNFDGEIAFCSKLQANVENHTRKTNPIVDYGPFGCKLEKENLYTKGEVIYYEGTTQTSQLTMACGSSQRVIGEVYSVSEWTNEKEAAVVLSVKGQKNNPIFFEKFICYTSMLDIDKPLLETFTRDTLEGAVKQGWQVLKEKQKIYMNRYWENADVSIEGTDSESLIQGIHFNLFHIMQSAGRDGRTGMGAKGLSGEGYEGHYFWDTEMYVLPVFIYTEPETAKRLLEYRFYTLPQARQRARILGHDKGALFPWRTINGEEASTYYPLGTAQYHINADISYALSLYLAVTKDVQFFKEKGAEILIETARVWADVGSFAECKDGKYCICDVTGPDEYNVLVDNNFYTNLMARENIRDALTAVHYLQIQDSKAFEILKKKLDFDESEMLLWSEIVEKMYFPYDEARDIYPMDDGFMMRKPWNEDKIPKEKRSWLYENYHPLFIMRHRMSKQADAILGMYLHSNHFSKEEIRRNYDFYQEVTLHHSSLSTCIFGIVACDIGYYDEAYQYFSQSARMDLDDYHNNFYAGIHAANMAGTWQAIVNGFAGMRCQEGKLSFCPYLPNEWESYVFHVRYEKAVLKVSVSREQVEFFLKEGESISFYVNGEQKMIREKGGKYIEKV